MELLAKMIISEINKLSVNGLLKWLYGKEIWIEDGKITGFILENGKLYKEIPAQTANPSGDE